ncbi:MAG: ATP-binding protein [Prochloraceae cyanobacterium]|nr:ATP-binding protein [Prochloraceae cyanobacterium]
MRLSLYNSLKFRMPLVVLTGVIPLILVTIFYATNRAAKTINKEAEENLILKTELLADNINRWNESNLIALKNLSQQPDVTGMSNIARMKSILATLVENYDSFYLAHVSTIDGWNIARSDYKKPKYYGDRAYFKGVLSNSEINFQALIGRTSKRPALCMAAPINPDKTNIIGVATACTDLGDLSTQVGELKFGNTGYVFIVNELGKVLAHPDPTFVSGTRLADFSKFAPVKHALEIDNKSRFSFQDNSGEEWFSWNEKLNNGWHVVIVQEKEDFLSSQQEFENLAFFIAVVAISGVSVLVFLIANRLIAPISNLTDAASAIADGQFSRAIKIQRSDELGILANSFDRMRVYLKSLFQNLEKRIEQRTVQFKQAKEEAEKASKKAIAANKSKDRFLANISHELRTPLNGILGYTKLVLTEEHKLDPSHSEYLRVVEKSGIHLLTLINDILDISQTKANRIELYPHDLDLPNFLDETIDLVFMSAKQKGLNLKKEWGQLPDRVIADEKRLRQILLNLLNNAIKFTEIGQVTLRVRNIDNIQNNNTLSHQKLRFEVIDTGVGIGKSELQKIFKPFEQVGDIKSRADGTGLGLSICKGLVELMGGKLQVNSKRGLGSSFWFDIVLPIPQKANQIQPKTEKNEIDIAIAQASKNTILVVDDKKINRDLLVAILEPKGFEVLTANNGEEMLKIAADREPDLILLDLFMPVKTGFTSAKELRKNPQLKDIPVIVVTASTITKDVSSYLDCEAVLHKPIQEDKLLSLIHKYLFKQEQTALDDIAL